MSDISTTHDSSAEPRPWRLARLYCKHYGPFEELDIPLDLPSQGETLLLEGPNGSGKTSLLEALAVLVGCNNQWGSEPRHWAWLAPLKHQEYLGTLAQEKTWQANASPVLVPDLRCSQRFTRDDGLVGVILEFESERIQLELTKARGWEVRGGGTWSEHLLATTAWNKRFLAAAAGEDMAVDWAAFSFRSHLSSPRLEVAGPATLEIPPLRGALSFGEFIRGGSLDLGQFLVNLDFQRIRLRVDAEEAAEETKRNSLLAQSRAFGQQIKSIADVFGQLTNEQVRIEIDRKRMVPRLLFNGVECPLDLLGEGYRHTIAWAADLLVRLLRIDWARGTPFEQPFWLLLDEVDQSLHPSLQIKLLPAIRRLFPNAFIIASTHSPFTVASVGEGQVISLQPTQTPSAVMHPLAHGQSLERVVEEIFSVDPVFLDAETREAFGFHRDCLRKLSSGIALTPEQAAAFLAKRAWLRGLNEEVAVVLSMRERPLRDKIRQLEAHAA